MNEKAFPTTFDELKTFAEATLGKKLEDADVMWFVAVKMAEVLHEDFKLRDHAELIVNGLQPLSKEDVAVWLKDISNDVAVDEMGTWAMAQFKEESS